ncbi:hypothetical protein PG911_00180 [Tenacibaculum ovolyticum]|uniref:hypothetical protein n=1 Tax=Tenacibaculum ovolyticum TaxID=104270 RepID=UPI0022F37FAD|nr:hypothetical protein [Tenacibaculum ovolyticum]WBX76709.1 hypothetical protein PG911_00180 [Tenacibaculum ovolyticum]
MKKIKKKEYNCPNCAHRMRIPKYKKIRFHCTRCGKTIEYNGKFSHPKYYLLIAASILLVVYLFFVRDYLTYQNVKELKTSESCISYYENYPNGFYTEDVKFIELDITRDINLIRAFLNKYRISSYTEEVRFIELDVAKDIELVRVFLKEYPKSNKKEEVLKINNDLWDFEIKNYDEKIKTKKGLDPKAVVFFKKLLIHMKKLNLSTISLSLSGDVDVKNYREYKPGIIKILDEITFSHAGRNISDNIVDIKKNYSQGNIRGYESIVSGAIENGFENILSHNFIKINTRYDYKHPIRINIDYEIKNQEKPFYKGDEHVPVIWTYNTTEPKNKFISFLIGVAINYKFNITLPDDESLSFEHKTNALDNISNIRSIEEGYMRMTAQNFNNYGAQLLTKFGLLNSEK